MTFVGGEKSCDGDNYAQSAFKESPLQIMGYLKCLI